MGISPYVLTFGRCAVGGSSQVAHCPHTRPESSDIGLARHTRRHFENHILVEAELVPSLQHARLEREAVDRLAKAAKGRR